MQADCGSIVVNPSFEDWVYENEKYPHALQTPMKRQITYRVEEEIGPKETKDDPWKQNDYQSTVREKYRGEGSRSAVMIFTFIMYLVAIAALVLILLMWFGKMGERCGCSTGDGKYVDKARLCEGEQIQRLVMLRPVGTDQLLFVQVFMYACPDRSRSLFEFSSCLCLSCMHSSSWSISPWTVEYRIS